MPCLKSTLSRVAAVGLMSSLAPAASADVPSPDPEGCRLECKQAGAACACRNGNTGTCVVVSKPRPGCPGGPPCASETLWCAPTKPAPAPGDSSGAGVSPRRWGCAAVPAPGGARRGEGALGAGLALAALVAVARRARRR